MLLINVKKHGELFIEKILLWLTFLVSRHPKRAYKNYQAHIMALCKQASYEISKNMGVFQHFHCSRCENLSAVLMSLIYL
jgi:hypothetical protein